MSGKTGLIEIDEETQKANLAKKQASDQKLTDEVLELAQQIQLEVSSENFEVVFNAIFQLRFSHRLR